MTSGIIKVEVSVISCSSADNTYQDLDYSGSQKPNYLITVLLYNCFEEYNNNQTVARNVN